METIPAINCLDLDCVERRLEQAAMFLPRGGWVHLDVADGDFTFNKTWADPLVWPQVAGQSFKLEVHLMCNSPELVVDSWLRAGAQRLIVHVETVDQAAFKKILEAANGYGAEVMLSLNPETPIEQVRPYFEDVSQFHVLAVNPGLAGQKFLPVVLGKAKLLRTLKPKARIEADGGINPETAKAAKESGVDVVTAASYIFWGSNPNEAYEELSQI